jgi:hypothetical protein
MNGGFPIGVELAGGGLAVMARAANLDIQSLQS